MYLFVGFTLFTYYFVVHIHFQCLLWGSGESGMYGQGAVPCQRSKEKGQRRKADIFLMKCERE